METIKKKKTTEKLNKLDLTEVIINLIDDKKGGNIVCMDLRKIPEAITDYFIICDCESTTQTRAITDYVEYEMAKKYGIKAFHVEGRSFGEWCLIDFGDVVVHIFQKERRAFYRLEELWHDAVIKEYKI
ncbi:MAG TPA: ribosome silencing factor [Chitinophagales bacterium]|nr:ribosome silencing factor [Chitinophagales bacterium]HMU97900.1 ribosome silencing factor [Chitinophagales bacterium]HMV02718.1 ribosome silencing factor [Chitinophagales bacterium]HMW94621.1 ribosome silencing factor [Chitinophagales bacterium]HMY42825.1 ribosome silencing factor [Chitinophagales bacterium]